METASKTRITVETLVNAPIAKVWEFWNAPEHITNWCYASPDWHSPSAENDLRVGGEFITTMAAKDGSVSFDFGGFYTNVDEFKSIEYTLGDDRKVSITFTEVDDGVSVEETFEAENTNPEELQRTGWQAILENFKNYVEAN